MRTRTWCGTAAMALAVTLLGSHPAEPPATAAVERVSAATPPAAAPSARARRPNILVVFTDDMRADDMRYMPRTRRLIGRRGTTFTRGLSENPLCCPFRATLLTGQYTHNNGVLSNKGRDGGYAALRPRRTLNVTMRERGYRTAYIGKYLNGYPGREAGRARRHHVPPGWSQWHSPVQGTYAPHRRLMNHNGRLRWRTGHADDYYGQLSSQVITRLARQREPFFATVSYLAPHRMRVRGQWAPPQPPTRHRGSLRGKMPPLRSGAFNEADVSDKPAHVRALPRLGKEQRQEVRTLRRLRAESLQAVDQAVAQNIAALRRTGELRNTVVAFTSDNGYLLGEHRVVGKVVPYEESVRVPLMIRGPGFRSGRSATLVGAVDLASTVAHAARITQDLPHPVDGRDLRRLDGRILLEAGAQLMRGVKLGANGPDSRSYVGVRTERYTYVRYATGEEELFDLRRDRHQETSVHDDPEHADDLAALRADTRRLEDCVGTDCRD